ncbi:PREDICTED: wall-associated receptor kinase-like 8 [Theobroma cacao]|uniref:Wall-associated receptor kinase-like 8 n=1 Tax=Theobroma cacao TaxID=3641 RepID=A0AB32W514_THECC|nr:PREDICTED: wall-associated receptor kinase-like 8 [Theobroma cacao]
MVVRYVSSFTFLLLLTIRLAFSASIAKNGCKDRCGNVSIPYPFGIGAKCSLNPWFEVSCNDTSSPPTISLTSIKMEVLEFRLGRDEYLRVKSPIISKNCSGRETSRRVNITGSPFCFSESMNKFIAAGCNNEAFMTGIEPTIVGCESACIGNRLFGPNPNATCDGSTCCETVIPSRLHVFNATFQSKESESEGCKLAFLVEEEWFYNNITDKSSAFQNVDYVPALLDWAIPDEAFELPTKRGRDYYCNGYRYMDTEPYYLNSSRCYCYGGYEGNAYLPNGCQDIDECLDGPHKRCGNATCVNRPGHYECERKKTWIIILGISLGFGVLCLAIAGWWLYKFLKKRRNIKLKKKFFKRNGGLLLQQQMSSSEGSIEKTKIFTSKELDKATDYFNKNRVLGQGGQGTVYKGMLVDGRIVAVKKSKVVDAEKVEEFINEVVILSQINHRNVVKLLGCCLETEVPLLVYEFIPNGTLFQYLHDQSEEFPLSWDTRLRIAKEIAEALSYLHSAASIPIYHRDIKSSNILLDEKYRAKVSDFGTSRSISIDQTHLTTHVQGTFGYLDPEYFQSSQFTEKSDVYSFGVVLVELLTSEKPISLERAEEGRSLATHFILSMEENQLFDIVDARVTKQAKDGEVVMVAKLAYRCLSLCGRKRPTMKEVAMELERILSLQNDSNVQHDQEEIEYVRIDVTCPRDGVSTSTGSVCDNRNAFSIESEPLICSKTK